VTEFDVLSAAAAGMDAQRAALNVAANNVAAAETGNDFARLVPQFRITTPSSIDEFAAPRLDQLDDVEPRSGLVEFAGTTKSAGASADAVTEMIVLLNAERAYEANASVFDAGKRLAERTIDIGRS
jgi:flagellar basal body rod protein FlgC